MGPQGTLRVHHLGRLCDLPARPGALRVEGEAGGDHHRVRVRRDPLHAVRRQSLDRRAAFVRSRLTAVACRGRQVRCLWALFDVRERVRTDPLRDVEGVRAGSTTLDQTHGEAEETAPRLPAARPPRLLQHFLMLVLAHLLAPLLDYGTHLPRTIAVRDARRPRAASPPWSRDPGAGP